MAFLLLHGIDFVISGHKRTFLADQALLPPAARRVRAGDYAPQQPE